MVQVLNAARAAGLRVCYALHHRYRPGDYETWKYLAPVQQAAWARKTFAHGTWGGEIRREFAPQPGDIVALEHWGSSGFANTDLDGSLAPPVRNFTRRGNLGVYKAINGLIFLFSQPSCPERHDGIDFRTLCFSMDLECIVNFCSVGARDPSC
jgi:hypothetical protein